jgi:hypothetical protein
LSFFLIEDFRAGLDVRKAADTSPAGTLTQFENAHVSSGGEVEKRLASPGKYVRALYSGQRDLRLWHNRRPANRDTRKHDLRPTNDLVQRTS